jgi:hypothetical protein
MRVSAQADIGRFAGVGKQAMGLKLHPKIQSKKYPEMTPGRHRKSHFALLGGFLRSVPGQEKM